MLYTMQLTTTSALCTQQKNRLVGLVVKAFASRADVAGTLNNQQTTKQSRAEDPGFESRLSRDFSGVESYQ